MAEQTKLCGKPHEYSDSFRCHHPVNDKGQHITPQPGWCLCSCASKNEDEFYYDKSGQRKASIETS